MLATRRNGLNKEVLDYNEGNPFIKTHKPLKKPHPLHLKRKYCSFVSHSIRQCLIRNNKPFKIKKVWVSKGY